MGFSENVKFFSAIISSITLCVIYVMNNFNNTELERKLMTNFQKVKFNLSLSFIGAFITSSLVTIWFIIKK